MTTTNESVAALRQALECAEDALTVTIAPSGEWPAAIKSKQREALKTVKAALAALPVTSAGEAAPLTWYDGAPPFPQDQEWFIAETTYGDRVVLVSLDEGREHKSNYAFKTADGTYLRLDAVKRWMQFPDCGYIPPPLPDAKRVPLSDERMRVLLNSAIAMANDDASLMELLMSGARAIEAAHGIVESKEAGHDR
jgi:hypothetical protein